VAQLLAKYCKCIILLLHCACNKYALPISRLPSKLTVSSPTPRRPSYAMPSDGWWVFKTERPRPKQANWTTEPRRVSQNCSSFLYELCWLADRPAALSGSSLLRPLSTYRPISMDDHTEMRWSNLILLDFSYWSMHVAMRTVATKASSLVRSVVHWS